MWSGVYWNGSDDGGDVGSTYAEASVDKGNRK